MRRRHALVIGIATTFTVLFGSISAAQAQYAPGYRPPPGYYGGYRQGIVIGAGLGFGAMSAVDCGTDCGAALAGELHIGGMLNPRMALMADLWSDIRDIPNSEATFWSGIYTAAVQYWLNEALWLKGGVGIAHAQIYGNISGAVYEDEVGFGMMGAGGYEIVRSPTFALDLQLRLARGFYDAHADLLNFGFLIGVTWY